MRRLLAAALLFVGMTGGAQPQVGDLSSADLFLKECINSQNPKTSANYYQGVCIGTIQTLVNLGERAAVGRKLGLCPPDPVTVGDAMRISVQYIQERPKRQHEPLALLALEALIAAWPCKDR